MLAPDTGGAKPGDSLRRTAHPVASRAGNRSRRLARALVYQFDVVAIGIKEIDRLAGDIRLDALV
jgi:hypothetical protein